MGAQYNLAAVICTIGGVAISGYGETDAIGFEWDAPLKEVTTTADGKKIYSVTNDRGLKVTITLSQQSRAYLLLAQLMEVQTGDNVGIPVPALLPLPFAFVDPSNGDGISSLDCVFMTRPAFNKGKTSGEVSFELHLPNPGVTYGLLNLI